MRYYDIKKNWRKVRKHIANYEVQRFLVGDMNRYSFGRWNKKFEAGMLPTDMDSSDWRYMYYSRTNKRGRQPAYFDYTCSFACHWLVNFNYELAKLVEPNLDWRILSSEKHSTVWDGKDMLFEFNFYAFEVPAKEAFDLANEIETREHIDTDYAEHYSKL